MGNYGIFALGTFSVFYSATRVKNLLFVLKLYYNFNFGNSQSGKISKFLYIYYLLWELSDRKYIRIYKNITCDKNTISKLFIYCRLSELIFQIRSEFLRISSAIKVSL